MTVAGGIDNDCHFAGQWQLAGILNVAKSSTWRRFFALQLRFEIYLIVLAKLLTNG